jgi:mannose-6-phosphate isomerase
MPLPPLPFRPVFKPALWGGTGLRPMFGAAPSDDPTGEAWVLADIGTDSSVVASGPLVGVSLRQLMQERSTELLGDDQPAGGRFPLLLKFIQAQQPLSVQVHPTDDLARQFQGPNAIGKTEAWVVLDSEPGAKLYAGLAPGTTAADFRKAIDGGDVEKLLRAHPAAVGECFFLPAGTVHAIGGGLLLFEIQQPSDLTYRLYDWNRADPKTGRTRELHVEKGLASVAWPHGPVEPVRWQPASNGRTPLVECPYFSLARWDADQPFRVGVAGRCRVVVGIAGEATLRHEGNEYAVGPGSVWLLPATCGGCECVPNGRVSLLECGPPANRP